MRNLCKVKNVLFILLIMMLAISFIAPFGAMNMPPAYAYSQQRNDIVVSTADADTFEGAIQPNWYTEAYRLLYAENDDYSTRTSTATYPKYYAPSGGIVAEAIPLNDEIFSADGTDVTGNYRLIPVTSLSDANNINAQSYASISFNQFRGFPAAYKCSMRDDTRKMKNLTADLAISGDNATVYLGKIMYRTAPYGAIQWGSWNYVDLVWGANLYFSGSQHVQIVLIYEIREEADGLFKPVQYHHIVGIYRFDIA